MKKILLVLIVGLTVSCANAQRYAVIDTKYILDKLPEYKNADGKMQAIANQWQKELDDMQNDLDKMYKNFEAEQYMLTEELKKKRVPKII